MDPLRPSGLPINDISIYRLIEATKHLNLSISPAMSIFFGSTTTLAEGVVTDVTDSTMANPMIFLSEEEESSDYQLMIWLLIGMVVNIIVMVVAGTGIMYYCKKRNLTDSAINGDGGLDVEKDKEEQQIEGAPAEIGIVHKEENRVKLIENAHISVLSTDYRIV